MASEATREVVPARDEAVAAPAAYPVSEAVAVLVARQRTKRPRIDLDDSIAQAKAAMLQAMKQARDARNLARNERRKKQRLIKKAGNLSAEDLERVAVLKRCGLSVGSSASSTAASSSRPSSAAGSSAPPSAASSPALGPVAAAPGLPATPPDSEHDDMANAEDDRS